MKPTTGRILHFYLPLTDKPDGRPFAAIVADVPQPDKAPDVVDLVCFGPSSIYYAGVKPKTSDQGGGWAWPPNASAPAEQIALP